VNMNVSEERFGGKGAIRVGRVGATFEGSAVEAGSVLGEGESGKGSEEKGRSVSYVNFIWWVAV
jgi:hypothetical protein